VTFGTKLGSIGLDRSSGLMLLFLVFAVLAPAACILWFMNDAARSQADAARRSVTDAYRGQLRFLRDRVDAFWQTRAAGLEKSAANPGAVGFQTAVTSGLADSIVYFNADGSLAYPKTPPVPAADPLANQPAWRAAQDLEDRGARVQAASAYAAIAQRATDASTAARAAQAQIRCLVQNGQKTEALSAIRKFLSSPAAKGMDLQGRLITADEQFLALRLSKRPNPEPIVALLNDYRAPIPAAQRLFLMDAVREFAPVEFPTLEAERLAARFLEGDASREIPGVWKLSSKHGRAIALYRTETVIAGARALLDPHNSASVRFTMIPPGVESAADSIAATPLLPGWQLSFSLLDTKPLDAVARQRTVSYLWAGYLVIAAMAALGLLAGHSIRRQVRLAHLKTDLVAAVSHELKTPLASMRVLVDALLDDAELDPRKTREYLQLMAGENLRLTRLIENFLTFARIERNRQRFSFAETSPSSVVEAALAAMRERLQDCHLEVDIAPDLPALRADESALVTVLVNLLDNACKYTPDDKRIALRAYREEEHVVFAVEDNGIGIPAREQKRIFRRFYQVDQRLARETGGCGLGLSIVEFIVRAHGGAVRVKSAPGSGSAFCVSLPPAGAEA
jgi:two-component system, OmpR family, phosphate regulon sensor histidine kinase PhoR